MANDPMFTTIYEMLQSVRSLRMTVTKISARGYSVFSLLTENRKLKTENCLSLKWLGLIDEHDGDVVLDFIQEAALVADEAVARFVQVNISLAFGTSQDIQ